MLLVFAGRPISNYILLSFQQPVGQATKRGKEFIILQRRHCSKKKW
jgi:hypothetical protein